MREHGQQTVLAGVHVLVVDTDPETRALLETVLGYCGGLVSQAASASEAVGIVSRYRPDVVVIDPGLAGTESDLVDRLRRGASHPTLPVVALLTAREGGVDGLRRAGYAAHLRTPLDPWALCRLIAGLARKP
jgi:CheY-like chemotaxis protein